MMNKSFILAVVIFCAACVNNEQTASAQNEAVQKYLNYPHDPVQNLFSKILLAYGLQQKCKMLNAEEFYTFDRSVNVAQTIFESYILTCGMAEDKLDISNYTRDMVAGSARFIGMAFPSCSSDEAKKALKKGVEVSLNFTNLTKPYLEKDLSSCKK